MPPAAIVLVVVLTIATNPPSHRLEYTRLLSGAATADMRKRAEAVVYVATGAQNVAGASANGFVVVVVVPLIVVTGDSSGNMFVFTVNDAASNTVTCGIMQPAGAVAFASGQVEPALEVAVPVT